MFTDLFLYGLLIPIVPFLLPERLHTPPSQIQSQTSTLLAAYAISQFLLSIPIGFVADKLPNRRIPFLFGLCALLASTILLFLGQTLPLLILARILQGFAAGVVWTVGLALVQETVGTAQLGMVIGGIFGFISTGELISPALGGILYDKAGMKAVFGLAFALLCVDFVMRLLVIEQKVASRKYGLVFPKSSSSTAGSSVTTSNQEIANEAAPLLPDTTSPIKDHPSFVIPASPSRLYRSAPILHPLLHPRTLTSFTITLLQALLLATFDATLPLEAHRLYNFTSLQSGLLFVPLTLPSLLTGPIAGRMVDKYGTKPAAVLGCFSIIPSLVLLRLPHAVLEPGKEQNVQIAWLALIFVFCSVSITILGSPGLVEASYVTEQYHLQNPGLFEEDGPYAKLYAVHSMVFSLGLSVGPIAAGFLRENIGWGNMNAVVAGFCGAIGLVCLKYLGGKPLSLKDAWWAIRHPRTQRVSEEETE